MALQIYLKPFCCVWNWILLTWMKWNEMNKIVRFSTMILSIHCHWLMQITNQQNKNNCIFYVATFTSSFNRMFVLRKNRKIGCQRSMRSNQLFLFFYTYLPGKNNFCNNFHWTVALNLATNYYILCMNSNVRI